MADRPYYQLNDNPDYNEQIPQLLDTDPASASKVFNPLIQMILNNIKATHTLAQQAVEIAQQAAAAVIDLSNVVQQNTSKITTLWDAVFGDITTNPFQITFANLDGITLTSGVWNATLQRLEC